MSREEKSCGESHVGFDRTAGKRDKYYCKVSEKVNLTFGSLLVKGTLIVTKTVRSLSSEFLVWELRNNVSAT